ncbi:MAG: hypothetical protein KatS3mg051_2133 [Anaerolineae bacterium]|nr:MAG: hypothetical protein KatS3mg051_2133 [Anaerolineae bacterium]
MFEHLARYPRILVSGPQRSGTTIATAMIAADTGHRRLLEEAFGVHSVTRLRLLLQQQNIVVQCPTMVAYLSDLVDDQALLVWMRRPVADILASQQRIGWNEDEFEKAKLGQAGSPLSSAELKYRWWLENRHRFRHTLELDYESLSAHPMWVPQERRAHFRARQIAP